MVGYCWFIFWQLLGLLLCSRLFSEKRSAVRLWLGSVTGSVLSMWAPIPFAFVLGFSRAAHALAAGAGAAVMAFLMLKKRRPASKRTPDTDRDAASDRPLAFLLPPMLLLWCWLLWSHTLQAVDGGMYTGQCTYGDMAMHLGFITSLAEQQTFPPYYSILPTVRISYPFLCDSVSASLYLLGSSLRGAYMFPMFFAFCQFAAGFFFLAREICREKHAPLLAFALFFFNGGLGMIYFFRDYSLRDLLTGFYKTPTNLIDKGMRWVNVIADMLLPQRATLFGWAALAAALYLLYRAVFREDERLFLPAGVLGGLLPMIHTHSFFALGLIAACWMAWSGYRDELSKKWFAGWLRFGLTAVGLALPQLLIWTFRSVGGNDSFLRLHFDWVNGGNENWFWFWLKNVGPLFILTPIAFLFGDREQRAVFSGAVLIFVLCEIVVFQPNVYDNNKLLYAGFFFCCFLSSDLILRSLGKLRSPGVRKLLLTLLLIVSLNAGAFTILREVVSGIPKYGYQLFSAEEVAAAGFIKENTESDAVFLTADNHDNPVAVLTGRNIVCGSPSYLFYHGLDYSDRQQTARQMLKDPEALEKFRQELDVDFVYAGYYERSPELIDYLRENYPEVYSTGNISIFDLR